MMSLVCCGNHAGHIVLVCIEPSVPQAIFGSVTMDRLAYVHIYMYVCEYITTLDIHFVNRFVQITSDWSKMLKHCSTCHHRVSGIIVSNCITAHWYMGKGIKYGHGDVHVVSARK